MSKLWFIILSEMFEQVKKQKKFLVFGTAVLFLSFSFNIFGTLSTDSFINNQKDSEALVTNQVLCSGAYYNNQLLQIKNYKGKYTQITCNPDELIPYSSQYGFQGKIYTLVYKIFNKFAPVNGIRFIALAQLVTALISALCLALVGLWVYVRVSKIAGWIFVFLASMSPMLVVFARNLYWALPLMVLPIIVILWFYKPNATKKYSMYFWSGVFLALYLRFICGYEYVTTLSIMAVAIISYFLFMEKFGWKMYLKQFAIAFAVSLLAFAFALGTHIYSLQQQTGSVHDAVLIIKSRALARTTDSTHYLKYTYMNLSYTSPDYYQTLDSYTQLSERTNSKSQISANVVSVMNYALLPVVTLPLAFNQPFGLFLQSTVVFVLVMILIFKDRSRLFKGARLHQVNGLFLGAAIGLVGSISWWVLAHSHSLVHAHINGITTYLPFALFSFMIIGLYIEENLKVLLRLRNS